MDADERTRIAIISTRLTLGNILNDPKALIMMANSDLVPDNIEDAVYSILAYLEKTAPDKSKETEKK